MGEGAQALHAHADLDRSRTHGPMAVPKVWAQEAREGAVEFEHEQGSVQVRLVVGAQQLAAFTTRASLVPVQWRGTGRVVCVCVCAGGSLCLCACLLVCGCENEPLRCSLAHSR